MATLVGAITGDNKKEAREKRRNQRHIREEWDKVAGMVPTVDQLHNEAPSLRLGQSAEAQAAADPRSIEAQLAALQGFQDSYQHEGMTSADQAAMGLARRDSAQYEKAQRDALTNRFAARGMGGSGTELAAQLGAQQGGANRLADTEAQMAVAARSRALQSMQSMASTGGQMRGQSFGEAQARGHAADAFNMNNMQYRRDVNRRNTDRYNTGLNDQFSAQRSVAAGRTGMYNDEMERTRQSNKDLQDTVKDAVEGGAQIARGVFA